MSPDAIVLIVGLLVAFAAGAVVWIIMREDQ